jgi:SAM-dependent methyltransferase
LHHHPFRVNIFGEEMAMTSTLKQNSPGALKRLKKMAMYAKGRILDVGFASIPNPWLHGEVIGFDLDKVECPNNYSEVLQGDILNSDLPSASFDTILAGQVIAHLRDPLRFLSECNRILKPGGTLVISTINPFYPPIILLNWLMIRKYYFCEDHIFEIAPRFMYRFLEGSGFLVKNIASLGFQLPIGKGQSIMIPTPRAWCYIIMYVADKQKKMNL